MKKVKVGLGKKTGQENQNIANVPSTLTKKIWWQSFLKENVVIFLSKLTWQYRRKMTKLTIKILIFAPKTLLPWICAIFHASCWNSLWWLKPPIFDFKFWIMWFWRIFCRVYFGNFLKPEFTILNSFYSMFNWQAVETPFDS